MHFNVGGPKSAILSRSQCVKCVAERRSNSLHICSTCVITYHWHASDYSVTSSSPCNNLKQFATSIRLVCTLDHTSRHFLHLQKRDVLYIRNISGSLRYVMLNLNVSWSPEKIQTCYSVVPMVACHKRSLANKHDTSKWTPSAQEQDFSRIIAISLPYGMRDLVPYKGHIEGVSINWCLLNNVLGSTF